MTYSTIPGRNTAVVSRAKSTPFARVWASLSGGSLKAPQATFSLSRWALSGLVLLSACSGIPLHEREKAQLDRFEAYAGPPVDRFTWLGRYDSWQPLSRDQLVIWTTPSDAYLIKVWSTCQNLQFANRVGITSTTHTVSARFDSVLVGRQNCPIEQIRPIDYRRMRQDLRQQTQEAKAAQEHSGT